MIEELSLGRLKQDVPVALNRLVVEYDHVLICGPVFPHEVVGFSGGTKYLFPGIAASEIIHFTHWLGALITSSDVLGTIDTPVRAVINRAAALLETPLSLLALVVTYEGVAGVFCGEATGNHDAWRQAAALSARRHVVWLDKPFDRVLTVMPAMYQDLWTAAKGVYKTEPAIADGGEVVVYAPHVREASQRARPRASTRSAITAATTSSRSGTASAVSRWASSRTRPTSRARAPTMRDSHVEAPRINVTLATGIPREQCEHLSLGYVDPADVDLTDWSTDMGSGAYKVPRAGELLFRVGKPPDAAEVTS